MNNSKFDEIMEKMTIAGLIVVFLSALVYVASKGELINLIF